MVRVLLRPRDRRQSMASADAGVAAAEDYGLRSIPQIETRRSAYGSIPALTDEVERGRHWLPGTVFGGRETLATGWLRAEPRHLLLLPGDGWWPFIAAAGTAGFFLLLTVAQMVLATLCGLLAVVAIVCWLWASDQPPPAPKPWWPTGSSCPSVRVGKASHSWWAMVILLVCRRVDLRFLAVHAPARGDGLVGVPAAGLAPARPIWRLGPPRCWPRASALMVGAGAGSDAAPGTCCALAVLLALVCCCSRPSRSTGVAYAASRPVAARRLERRRRRAAGLAGPARRDAGPGGRPTCWRARGRRADGRSPRHARQLPR
jgi:cytochrome c oxidase subunit I+III